MPIIDGSLSAFQYTVEPQLGQKRLCTVPPLAASRVNSFEIPGDGNSVDRIKGADPKWGAGSALAVKTMAGDNQS